MTSVLSGPAKRAALAALRGRGVHVTAELESEVAVAGTGMLHETSRPLFLLGDMPLGVIHTSHG